MSNLSEGIVKIVDAKQMNPLSIFVPKVKSVVSIMLTMTERGMTISKCPANLRFVRLQNTGLGPSLSQ